MTWAARAPSWTMTLTAIAGCGPAALGPSQPADVAPTGSEVRVRLETPVGSEFSLPGQRVRGTLDAPLYAPTGAVVAPVGASLRGRVVEVRSSPVASVRVRFDRIVVHGTEVALVVAPLADPSSGLRSAAVDARGSKLLEFVAPRLRGPDAGAIGGGPSSAGVDVSPGTSVRLVLVQPLHVVRPDAGR